MPSALRFTPRLGKFLGKWQVEISRQAVVEAHRRAVEESPGPEKTATSTGEHRASHRTSPRSPRAANLGSGFPSYPVPTDEDARSGLEDLRPGDVAFLANDRATNEGFPVHRLVEAEGWASRAPYEPYRKADAHIKRRAPAIVARATVTAVKRFWRGRRAA